MGSHKSAPPTCFPNQHCSQWARIYFKYCLCNAKDAIALFLGIISILSWGVAEVPQIITNYREKSTEGLSISFLLTWIAGDLLNLTGCLLEPTTIYPCKAHHVIQSILLFINTNSELPTQYYMALLYTATTLMLTGQTVYYGHIYRRLKANRSMVPSKGQKYNQEEASVNVSLLRDEERSDDQANGASPSKSIPTAPIPVGSNSSGRELYFMSPRLFQLSPIPAPEYFLAHSQDTRRLSSVDDDQQSASKDSSLDMRVTAKSAPSNLVTKNMLAVVPSAALCLGICVFHLCSNNVQTVSANQVVILVGRKLLQDNLQDVESRNIGTFLGCAMAVIYMGGRLPQICLNIRRGNVQGLSPLMFVFALIGNITYVGSILFKSLKWSKIGPNLPWIIDAGGCVILDAFILIQFIYYYPRKHKPESQDNPV